MLLKKWITLGFEYIISPTHSRITFLLNSFQVKETYTSTYLTYEHKLHLHCHFVFDINEFNCCSNSMYIIILYIINQCFVNKIQTYTHTHSCTNIHTHTHSCTNIHTHSCTHMHTHTHSCTHMHRNTHSCTNIHTHTHSYTHIHRNTLLTNQHDKSVDLHKFTTKLWSYTRNSTLSDFLSNLLSHHYYYLLNYRKRQFTYNY